MVPVAEVVLDDGVEAVAAPGDVDPPPTGHQASHLSTEQGGPRLAYTFIIIRMGTFA